MFIFPKFSNIQKVTARERIIFSCTGCGVCCKNVRDSLLLTPLDAYRLINFLQKEGVKVQPYGNFGKHCRTERIDLRLLCLCAENSQ